MPVNLVPILDQSKSYIYCPLCSQVGTPHSPLTRENHLHKCQFGHTFDDAQLRGMASRGVPIEMEKWRVIENPPPYAEKFTVWCHPQVWEALQCKWEGRFIATIITFFEAMADDSIIFIDGEDAKKLRELGVTNGVTMRALVEKQAELEKQIDEMNKIQSKLLPLLQQAGVGGLL